MIPPATGIFVGDGVLGDELNLSPSPLPPWEGDRGELAPRAAAAIKLFRSDNELRRFFLSDLAGSFFSSGGGEAPIVLSLDPGP
jgi:hypothetical protein